MKKLLLLVILFTAGISLMAQPKPGSFFAGGSVNFYTDKDKSKDGGTSTVTYNGTNLSIYPQAGYFLSDKIAVGAELGIRLHTAKYPNSTYNPKQTQNGFSFAPFARYYVINQKFGLFCEAGMSIGFANNKNYYTAYPTDETKITSFYLGVSPGIYYSVSDHLMLESKIGWMGYQSSKYKYSDNSTDIYNEFGLDISSSDISFGFTWIF